MTKMVCISGSARDGNTVGIADIYVKEFQERGWETSKIYLDRISINSCTGCLSCDDTQTCIFDDRDDMKDYINAILESDLIIMGTPARWGLLSGNLKVFIDRLNPQAAIEGYTNKKIFVYAVGQSTAENPESVNNALNSILIFARDAGMEIIGTNLFLGLLNEKEYLDKYDEYSKICKIDVDNMLLRS